MFWLLFNFLLLLLLLELVLFSVHFGLLEPGPKCEVMEDYASCHSDVQACSFLGILWDVHKEVAQLLMNRQHSRPFVAQKESSAAGERVALDRHAAFSDFHSADPDAPFVESLLAFLKRNKGLVLNLLVSALIAKHLEFFKDLHLLGLRPIRYEKHFIQPKSTGTSDDIADIVLLADVMQQQIPSRSLLLSFLSLLLHHQYIINLTHQIHGFI